MPSNHPSPLLLTSVTGPVEAAVALRGRVDILDLKDPREGSLGACPPAVLRAVVALRDAAAGRVVPVSAALGDAPDLPGTFALAAAGAASCGVDYLKVGLRGLRTEEGAGLFLDAVVRAAGEVSAAVRVIAVGFADAGAIDALEPQLLPRVAGRSGAHGCMIDTALKDGRTLCDHLDAGALARFVSDCRRHGLLCGLAGSLRLEHLPRLIEIGPDVIGVRGAICEGGRGGRIDPRRLREFRDGLFRASGGPGRSVPGPRDPLRPTSEPPA